jgi:hypothetical protein
MPDATTPAPRHIAAPKLPEALVDVLDSLLDTGVVADAQLVISVAGVDLVFVGLRALLASMDTAGRMMVAPPPPDTSAARAAS